MYQISILNEKKERIILPEEFATEKKANAAIENRGYKVTGPRLPRLSPLIYSRGMPMSRVHVASSNEKAENRRDRQKNT
jgi:hypothetical protein